MQSKRCLKLRVTVKNKTRIPDRILKSFAEHACARAECPGHVVVQVSYSREYCTGWAYRWGFRILFPKTMTDKLRYAWDIYGTFVHEAKHTADFRNGLPFDKVVYDSGRRRWSRRKKWAHRPEEIRAIFTANSAIAAAKRGDDPKAVKLVNAFVEALCV